jgi:hypothetical protein
MPKLNRLIAIKTLIAVALFSVLAAIAGKQLAPTVPLTQVLLMTAIGAAAFLIGLVLLTIVALTFRQFILRLGGTDAQWFWFKSEPPGLVQLREEARAAKARQSS